MPTLITGNEGTVHVLTDMEVTNDGCSGTPQTDNQTHLVSSRAACAEHEEATQCGKGVKCMFLLVGLFLPYAVCSTTIIASLIVYMCSGKVKKHGKRTQQVEQNSGFQAASGYTRGEDKAS